nr:DNA starvation/stationary phase protection protein [Propionicimonas sp.]
MATTTTDRIADAPTTADQAARAAQFLTPVVIDLEALVVNGKQAHWHTRGANFIGIHELLDEVVAHAQEYADTAAERVVALGLPLDSRISTVAKKNTLPEPAAGFQSWEDTVAEVVGMIDAALATVHAAITGLEGGDVSTQDVAVEIERGLTKDRWLLQAHVSA